MAGPKEICSKGEWFPVEHEIIDIYAKHVGVGACLVYLCLLRHKNSKDNYSFPSQSLMAKKLGVDRGTIEAYLDTLIENKWIGVSKHKNIGGRFPNNVYHFRQKEEWVIPGTWQLRKSKNKSPPCGKSTHSPEESLLTKKINNKKKISIRELREELSKKLTYKHGNYYKNN